MVTDLKERKEGTQDGWEGRKEAGNDIITSSQKIKEVRKLRAFEKVVKPN